jgi:hypothetical protein
MSIRSLCMTPTNHKAPSTGQQPQAQASQILAAISMTNLKRAQSRNSTQTTTERPLLRVWDPTSLPALMLLPSSLPPLVVLQRLIVHFQPCNTPNLIRPLRLISVTTPARLIKRNLFKPCRQINLTTPKNHKITTPNRLRAVEVALIYQSKNLQFRPWNRLSSNQT